MKKLLDKFIKALDKKADDIPVGWYSIEQVSKHIKLGRYQTMMKLHDGVKNGTVIMKKFRMKNSINRFFWTNLYKTK